MPSRSPCTPGHALVKVLSCLSLLLGTTTLAMAAEATQELDCVIEPYLVVDLGSAVPGLIESVNVDRSDPVTAGQTVARLEAGVESATVELSRERSQLSTDVRIGEVSRDFEARNQSRTDNLYVKNAVPLNLRDEARRDADLSKLRLRKAREERRLAALELRRAQAALARRTIVSPITGVVVERFKSRGEYVDDQPIMRVAQLNPLRVEVILPVERFGEVSAGMIARVTPELGDAGKLEATVVAVDQVLDTASGTFGVKLDLPNSDHQLPGGLKCRVSFPQPSLAVAAARDLGDEQTPAPSTAEADGSSEGERTTERPVPALDEPPEIPVADSTIATSADASACLRIGPLAEVEHARALVRALQPQATRVTRQEISATRPNGYLVLTSPSDGSRANPSFLSQLKAKGLHDAFVLNSGDYPGQISLGYFKRRDQAEARAGQLKKLDIDAHAMPRLLSISQHWVEVEGGAGTLDEDRLRSIARLVIPGATPGFAACSTLVTAHR